MRICIPLVAIGNCAKTELEALATVVVVVDRDSLILVVYGERTNRERWSCRRCDGSCLHKESKDRSDSKL